MDLLLDTVRRFVEREVRPTARALEHADQYPHALVERMVELGLFGMGVPSGVRRARPRLRDLRAHLRGAVARLDVARRRARHPRHRVLPGARPSAPTSRSGASCPRSPPGRLRGGLALTEPQGGSDVANLSTRARADAAPRRRLDPRRRKAVHHQHPRGQRLRRGGAHRAAPAPAGCRRSSSRRRASPPARSSRASRSESSATRASRPRR